MRSTLTSGNSVQRHSQTLPVLHWVVVALSCFPVTADSQQAKPAPPPFKPAPPPVRMYLPNIANEDWSFLKDPKYRADFWDPIKYISLKPENWYLTLGGEIRLRPEGFRVRSAQGRPAILDNYLLHRYLFGADLHMGKRFRVFGEFQSGITNGKLASPRPTDKNLADIHQGFFEYKSASEGRRQVVIRAGRQELTVGSSRLIAASQGLNVKRSFDGFLAMYQRDSWTIEGAAARLVKLRPGFFDDPPDHEQTFWGAAVSRRSFPWKSSQVGLYYLGIDRRVSQYVQGLGPEQRHTVGGKLTGTQGSFDFNFDLIGQWGRFQNAGIRSWAISTTTGYRFRTWRFRPRLAVAANAASGDADPADNQLGSFNPLFPGNSYSGLVGLLGPTNLTDVTPSFQLSLRRNVLLIFESPSYFRTSTGDGVYSIDLRLLLSPAGKADRYVGTNPGVVVAWQATRHINLSGVISRFLSGPFLKGTFVENGFGFYSLAFTYRF